jgi:hypothetical protein
VLRGLATNWNQLVGKYLLKSGSSPGIIKSLIFDYLDNGQLVWLSYVSDHGSIFHCLGQGNVTGYIYLGQSKCEGNPYTSMPWSMLC